MFRLFCKDWPLRLIGLPVRIRNRGNYDLGKQQMIGAIPALHHWIKYSTSPDRERGEVANVLTEDQRNKEGAGERVHRFIAWLGGYYSKKAVLFRSSSQIYENCIDSLVTKDFFKALDLPDTYQSWFIVAHLHLWLCLVRLKREGEDGSAIIKELVTMFWEDARQRMKTVGVRSNRVISRNITEYHHAFNGLLVAYEEGLVYDDMMLASALWRNIYYERKQTDPMKLAMLVEYIRKQVHHMDSIDSNTILASGALNFLSL